MVNVHTLELLILRFNNLYDELVFDNPIVILLGASIIEECLRQDKNITISKTTDQEILIYTNNDKCFNNLAIDKDGDVEFVSIPEDRTMIYNEYFNYEENMEIETMVSML